MKANAPEKIYRTTTYLDNDKGKTLWKKQPVAGAENIEYIRADAFIEKACEWLKENADMYEAFEPESKSYYMDKVAMIEDFKKVFDKYAVDFNEEPVSEKECMYSKDNYTDEDRKVLCDGCEEECEFNKKEEPVSEIDFEQELYKYFGQVRDFSLGMRIAKRFYEIGRNNQEPASEDLEEAAQRYNEDMSWCWEAPRYPHLEAFKAGANWQKKQMMKKAFSVEIGKQRPDYKCVLNGNFFKYDTGDKVKLIIIKEDKV